MAEKPLPRMRKQIERSQKELVRLLVVRRKGIEAVLMKWARDPKIATSEAVRQRMYKDIVAEYNRLQAEIERWGGEVVKQSTKEFFDKAREDVGNSNLISVTREKSKMKKYLDDLMPRNGVPIAATQTKNMLAKDIRQVRSAVVEVFRQSQVTQMSARERQKLLQAAVTEMANGKLNSWQFIDRAGKKWNNGNYFNMLNRTTVSRVSRNAYTDGLLEAGHDLATIEGGGDPCPACSAWRGVVVSLSGANKDYPSLADAEASGVFHPNCTCSTLYVDKTIHKDLIEQQANTPNPDKPSPEAWTEYAKKIDKRAQPKTAVDARSKALIVDSKKDKALKAGNTNG